MKDKSRLFAANTIMVVLLMLQTGEAKIGLTGRVVNGTRNDRAVSNQPVNLYENANNKKPILQTTTDKTGAFHFPLADSLLNSSFSTTTHFQESEYYGPLFQVDRKEMQLKDLIVYESTDSDSNIVVAMEHLVITPGPEGLEIKDIYFAENKGKTTFTGGRQVATDKFSTFGIPIPVGAEDIGVGGDLMDCCAILKDGRIHETMPFNPGVRQEIVTYRYPYEGQAATIEKEIAYPTAVFDIFIADSTVAVRGDGLVSMGLFEIRGIKYSHYKVEKLTRSNYQIHLSGLPGKPANFTWTLFVVVGIIILGFIGYSVRNRNGAQPPNADSEDGASAEEKRISMIQRIAELDDLMEVGEIDPAAYHDERQRLKNHILQLQSSKQEDS